MIIIGITGGIGCGKSFVSNLLKRQGAPVYDCDEAARYVMVSDENIIAQLKELIDESVYNEDGSINKAVVSEYLYKSEENRLKLNAVVHPAVRKHFVNWTKTFSAPVAFVECALLFESGFNELVDKVVEVYASEEVRIHRIVQRDHITRNQASERIKAQMSETEKLKLADFCIINNGNINVNRQIDNIVRQILAK